MKYHIPEDELKYYHDELGLSQREIAKKYGCSRGVIENRLEKYNIEAHEPPIKFDVPEEILQKLYWDEGMSQREIAERFSASVGQIQRAFHKYEIPTRSISDAVKLAFQEKNLDKLDISDDQLKSEYEEGASMSVLADRYDCDTSTIIRRLQRTDVAIRNYTYNVPSGKESPNYAGDFTYINGYKRLYEPGHPESSPAGRVFEHRYVYYNTYGEIPDGWHVHHIDDDKLNNDPENLVAIPHKTHSHLHNTANKEVRKALEAEYIMKRDNDN